MRSKTLTEGQDYVIRVVPFPNCCVDGAVVSHPDLVCVYINQNVCIERQRKALVHELTHIANDDLYSNESAEEIEDRMSI